MQYHEKKLLPIGRLASSHKIV